MRDDDNPLKFEMLPGVSGYFRYNGHDVNQSC
jgi:hypothetical protein